MTIEQKSGPANTFRRSFLASLEDRVAADASLAPLISALEQTDCLEGAAAAPCVAQDRLDAMLELNGETRWKNDVSGASEPHSGGTVVYLSPGIRLSHGKIGAFVSAGFPIVDDPKGVQTDIDFRLVGGVGIAF